MGKRKMITQEDVDKRFARRNNEHLEAYPEDVALIRFIIKDSLGLEISDDQAVTFWEWESENFCASWLTVQYDGDSDAKTRILDAFKSFVNSAF